MKNLLQTLLFVLLTMMSTSALLAQEVVDSVDIYFGKGLSKVDVSLGENKARLMELLGSYLNYSRGSRYFLKKIRIESAASPEGGKELNDRLSRQRADALLEYLKQYPLFDERKVEVVSLGVDWEGLETQISGLDEVPSQDKVLELLSHHKDYHQRFSALQSLDEGEPYQWMYHRFFPELRRVRIVFWVEEAPEMPLTSISLPEAVFLQPSAFVARRVMTTDETTPVVELVPESQPFQRWALKTNFLYDALLSPSIEVEYRINRHWSALAEFSIAWWKNSGKHKYYQLAQFSPEVRYWLDGTRPWRGHYLGAFLGVGYYDLQNGKDGYKGEFGMAGLSYGYMFPIGRNLSLDAGIGLGCLFTEYEEYLPIQGHYVYQQTSRTNYVGPVKAKLSLTWRIGQQKIDRLFRRMKGGVR